MAKDSDNPTGILRFKPEFRKIDVINSEEFLTQLLGYAGTSRRLVLDLGNVQFIDSSGLGKIIAGLRQFRENGGDMRLCGVQAPVSVLFTLVRLGEIVGIDPDEETSLRELAAGAASTARSPAKD